MFGNIVFIGGIHGVGKSTICRNICKELYMEYLSASELLKWQEINSDSKNKKVMNIPITQNRLLLGLKKTVKENLHYVLDGHFCLLNEENKVVDVPEETFREINPKALCLILGDVLEIKKRLETRDNKPYEYETLELLQIREMDYAKHLSKSLRVPLFIGKSNDYINVLNSLAKINICN